MHPNSGIGFSGNPQQSTFLAMEIIVEIKHVAKWQTKKNCSSSEPNSKAIARRHFVHCAHARNLCSSHTVGAHFQTCVKMRENVTHEFYQFCLKQQAKTSTRGPRGHHKSHQQVFTSDLCKTSYFFLADAWILNLPCSRMKRVAAVLPCWTTVSPAKSKCRSSAKLENVSCLMSLNSVEPLKKSNKETEIWDDSCNNIHMDDIHKSTSHAF